jgi:hypothetical protein
MKAAKQEFLTSMLWNCACSLLQAENRRKNYLLLLNACHIKNSFQLSCNRLMRRGLPTAQFELLDNIADLLKAVDVGVLSSNRVSDDEKGCPLK